MRNNNKKKRRNFFQVYVNELRSNLSLLIDLLWESQFEKKNKNLNFEKILQDSISIVRDTLKAAFWKIIQRKEKKSCRENKICIELSQHKAIPWSQNGADFGGIKIFEFFLCQVFACAYFSIEKNPMQKPKAL